MATRGSSGSKSNTQTDSKPTRRSARGGQQVDQGSIQQGGPELVVGMAKRHHAHVMGQLEGAPNRLALVDPPVNPRRGEELAKLWPQGIQLPELWVFEMVCRAVALDESSAAYAAQSASRPGASPVTAVVGRHDNFNYLVEALQSKELWRKSINPPKADPQAEDRLQVLRMATLAASVLDVRDRISRLHGTQLHKENSWVHRFKAEVAVLVNGLDGLNKPPSSGQSLGDGDDNQALLDGHPTPLLDGQAGLERATLFSRRQGNLRKFNVPIGMAVRGPLFQEFREALEYQLAHTLQSEHSHSRASRGDDAPVLELGA